MLERPPPRAGRLPDVGRGSGASVAVVAGLLVGAVAFAVGWPAAGVVVAVVRGAVRDPGAAAAALAVSPGVLARSVAAAGGIAVLATALAWGPARVLASGRARALAPLLVAPMLMPMYLAFSGWGQARAPGTMVGDWIERLAGEGHRWVPIFAGRALAVVGLALWAVPIAALILAGDLARRDASIEDALRLERAGWWRRALVRAGLTRAGLAWSVVAVTLVMLGSAVPLHLAQLETSAIVTWRKLAENGPGEWWRVWVGSWVVVVVAVVGGWVVGGRVVAGLRDTREGAAGAGAPVPARAGAYLGAAAVWMLGVGGPLALFAWTLDRWSRVATFFELEGRGVAASATLAGLCAIGVAGLAMGTSFVLSTGSRRAAGVVGVVLRVLVVSALIPGVLVGAAVARCGYEGPGAVVAAHLARFGVLGVGVGCWLAWAEPPERRALRRVDGVAPLRAWAGACLPLQWAPMVGVGLAAFALSVHEIEASVIVQPPGVPSLAQYMLGLLHYARTLDLAAGAIVTIGGGLVVAVVAAALVGVGSRQPVRTGRSIR
ncbi:MAG: hypothetical protein R3B49_01055 [Phycisphaerales bacterium]